MRQGTSTIERRGTIVTRGAVGLLAAALISWSVPAMAQSYPNRPIKMVVPFTPGTSMDIVARAVGAAGSANTIVLSDNTRITFGGLSSVSTTTFV